MTRAEILAAAREIVKSDLHYYPDGLKANLARELLRLHDGAPWTSDPPTVPGWYWWREELDLGVKVVWVSSFGIVFQMHEPSKAVMDIGGQWLGPVEPADCATIAELRRENERLKAENFDLQIELDSFKGTLDNLADEARKAHEAGNTTEI